ncbi:hypothetical protein [Nocardia seriolae]|uniref:hypothetical protein n=1 Tax=Nocardia seriolae TaxID=37332 RepID=UPI003F7537BA
MIAVVVSGLNRCTYCAVVARVRTAGAGRCGDGRPDRDQLRHAGWTPVARPSAPTSRAHAAPG